MSQSKTEQATADVIPMATGRTPLSTTQVNHALRDAALMVPPLWPLENFVATNPYIGFTDKAFGEAGGRLKQAGIGDVLMPADYYLERITSGDIGSEDLLAARQTVGGKGPIWDLDDLRRRLKTTKRVTEPTWQSYADIVAQQEQTDYPTAIVDQIGEWASAYFDHGQAIWPSPFRALEPYSAWREEMLLSASPSVLGLSITREETAALPLEADAIIARTAAHLELDETTLPHYLSRLASSIPGWAGHARYREWHEAQAGGLPVQTMQLLAIRAAWDLLLFERFHTPALEACWQSNLNAMTSKTASAVQSARRYRLIAHTALENARRRQLFAEAFPAGQKDTQPAVTTPSMQAVFCIDVRSERLRRTLEMMDSDIETFGFAGFFGMPIEVLTIDGTDNDAQCPVLLQPQIKVRQASDSADATESLLARVRRNRQVDAAWRTFHGAAISSFAYVEALGLRYAWRMLAESLKSVFGRNQQRDVPGKVVLEGDNIEQLARYRDGSADMAESILRGMSLTRDFAPIVALIGHGSSASNNPYASRYHCGACGGHTGDSNARMAVALLNDMDVRKQLRGRGIDIPGSTQFVAGLHDTSTDEVSLLDVESLKTPHAPELHSLQTLFARAAAVVRRQRAADHGVTDEDDDTLLQRSRNWAEVRPEWGLVGCHGFIAAPRETTRHANLHGRCFLHNYNWQDDTGFEVLELIMTAPLVVASWISLQYYASTVDNGRLGSGDKTLHNVVGGIGVLEGTKGDLRVGLPWQSVHDGNAFLHEPLRLNAVIAAPQEAITGILMKHEAVRDLFDNQWLHLYALDDAGQLSKYAGDLMWSASDVPVSENVQREAS
ncbi:MAG: DUF2309 domain-containing protein [Pseudomonadota bacterium]